MTTPTTVQVRFQFRADTAANWTSIDPVLLANELGRETDTGKIKIGDGTTAWSSLGYQALGRISNADIATDAAIAHSKLADITAGSVLLGNASDVPTATALSGDVTVDSSGVTAISAGAIVDADVSASAEIAVSKLANGSANQILTTDGTDVSWTSNPTIAGNVIIQGNLTVNGTETIINVDTLQVEDKTIEMGVVATPTDLTADGGGIVLKGASDKTILWVDSTDSWTSSENIDLASGKTYKIAGTDVLSATALGSNVQISSANIPDGTVTNADLAGSIADSKLNTISTAGKVSNSATTATDANTASAIVARDASGNFSAGTITADLSGNASTVTTNANLTGDVTSVGNATSIAAGVIVDGDVNASAAIAGTKIDPDFGAQNLTVDTDTFFVDATGDRVGVGTTGPNSPLEVGTSGINFDGAIAALPPSSADAAAFIARTASTGSAPFNQAGSIVYRPRVSSTAGRSSHIFYTGSPSAIRMVIDETGNVGIGTTAPTVNLQIQDDDSFSLIRMIASDTSVAGIDFGDAADADIGGIRYTNSDNAMAFRTNNSERARIDSSGRLLVGTNTSTKSDKLIVQANTSDSTGAGVLGLYRGSTTVSAGSNLGYLNYCDSDGNRGAWIFAEGDGNWTGGTSHPTRLVFSTTASGGTTPTERLRISSDGAFGLSGANYGTSGQVLTSNGSSAAPTWQNAGAGAGLFTSYAIIADQKAQNTEGGTFTSAGWRIRDLNTELYDPDGIVSISSNEFTLAAGTYFIEWAAPGFRCNSHMARLYDVTGAAAVQTGQSAFADTGADGDQTNAVGWARVTITASNAYRIEHYAISGAATRGFGIASNIDVETYTVVKIFKEA